MDKISRQEAKDRGLTRYFTGNPCPRGHVTERLVASKDCHACALGRLKTQYRKDPQKYHAAAAKWRENNPEATKAMACRASIKWSRNNPEIVKANITKWRKRNPEKQRAHGLKWSKANPDVVQRRTMRWRKENPDKHRANWTRRRAWKRGADGTFTDGNIELLRRTQNDRCAGCACDISVGYTIDHIMPLSRGGSNWPDNLQLLCVSCNSSKQDKTMEEWRQVIPKRLAGGR